MFNMHILHVLSTLAFFAASAVAHLHLNVTAIGAHNDSSTLECWEVLDSPFYISDDPATAGAMVSNLGDVSTLSWSISPPGLYVDLHNTPYNQWIILIKGFGHMTVPGDDSGGAYMSPGEFGLMFAADTADVSCDGHTSRYLGASESVYVEIPTKDGEIPEHNILHMGPCAADEMASWRSRFTE